MNKVFGIGLSRTGTTSLNRALCLLSVPSIHCPHPNYYHSFYDKLFEGECDISQFKYYDGFTDIPFALNFKGFYKKYPKSKFILTVRKKEDWLKSMERFFKNIPKNEYNRKLRVEMYGVDSFDHDQLSKIYDEYHENVFKFFEDKLDQFLMLDICGGERWEPLAKFVGVDVPSHKFPHDNSMRK